MFTRLHPNPLYYYSSAHNNHKRALLLGCGGGDCLASLLNQVLGGFSLPRVPLCSDLVCLLAAKARKIRGELPLSQYSIFVEQDFAAVCVPDGFHSLFILSHPPKRRGGTNLWDPPHCLGGGLQCNSQSFYPLL